MPFQSESQRACMYANDPAMAKRWEAHTPKGKKLPKRKSRPTINSAREVRLKKDPSQTFTLRKRFETEVKRRFNRIKSAILDLVKREDAFGLTANFNPSQPRDNRGRWSSGGTNVSLGYSTDLFDPDAERSDIPSQAIIDVLKPEIEKATETLKQLGLSHLITELQIVDDPSPTSAVAMALGNGRVRLQVSTAKLDQLSQQFKSDKEMREKGDAPVFAMGSIEDVLLHEAGHNLHRSLSPAKHKEFEGIFKSHSQVDNLPSYWAQENSSEAFAETFLATSKSKPFGGTADYYSPPKPIFKDFVSDAVSLSSTGLTANTRWKFRTNPQKVEEFRKWVLEHLQDQVLESNDSTDPNKWWDAYVLEAYQKGQLSSFDAKNKKGMQQKLDFYNGTREQFLRDSFAQPETKEKIQLMAGRIFTDLKGVTDTMATAMSRVLVEGLSQGEHPSVIARQLIKDVDSIGINRARMIARTEVIRAHAEGQLDALESLGVEEVGVMVEWTDTEDGRVCPSCQAMSGVVFKVKEAHGLIPRHPNCRCAFLPANVGESKAGQVRGKSAISKAIDRSIKREIPKGSKRTLAEQKAKTKWAGADAKISKQRPKSIVTNYDPDQARDNRGRWTSGGGGSIGESVKLTQDLMKDGADSTGPLMDVAALRVAKNWEVSDEDVVALLKEDGLTEAEILKYGQGEGGIKGLAARRFIRSWAASSGDAVSVGVSVHVSKKLGVDPSLYESETRYIKWFEDHPNTQRAVASFGEAMYKTTQDWLSKKGISEVKVLRSGKHNESRPFSSWSVSHAGVRDHSKLVTEEVVSAKYILSIPPTGFGTLAESEVVLLARKSGPPTINRYSI